MKSCGCGEHQRTTENAWDEILHNTDSPVDGLLLSLLINEIP